MRYEFFITQLKVLKYHLLSIIHKAYNLAEITKHTSLNNTLLVFPLCILKREFDFFLKPYFFI